VKKAVTIRYYLQSMGAKVVKPTVIYGDTLSAITNATIPGSQLKKRTWLCHIISAENILVWAL